MGLTLPVVLNGLGGAAVINFVKQRLLPSLINPATPLPPQAKVVVGAVMVGQAAYLLLDEPTRNQLVDFVKQVYCTVNPSAGICQVMPTSPGRYRIEGIYETQGLGTDKFVFNTQIGVQAKPPFRIGDYNGNPRSAIYDANNLRVVSNLYQLASISRYCILTSEASANGCPAPPPKWEDLTPQQRQEIVDTLTNTNWKDFIASRPITNTLQDSFGQTTQGDMLLTGDPTSPIEADRPPREVPIGTPIPTIFIDQPHHAAAHAVGQSQPIQTLQQTTQALGTQNQQITQQVQQLEQTVNTNTQPIQQQINQQVLPKLEEIRLEFPGLGEVITNIPGQVQQVIPGAVGTALNDSIPLQEISQSIPNVQQQLQNIQNNIQDQLAAPLQQIGQQVNQTTIALPGITEAINSIPGQTELLIPAAIGTALSQSATQEKLGTIVGDATCQALSGNNKCAGNPLPSMNNKLDDIVQKLDQATQAAQGVLLKSIDDGVKLLNTKVGDVAAFGSISQAVNGFIGSAAVDRVVNLVTMAGVIHNCMMLSTSIKDTFFECMDNLFAIPALIEDPNADTIDTSDVFTKYLDSYFSNLFGATEWTAIKAQWKAYSTIYNTGAQVFGNVRDIFEETQNINETTRNWVAELGNGLQDEGLIGEDNWNYKDPNQRPKGKYFGRLQRIAEGLETIENVFEDLENITSSARNIVETANEIKENAATIQTAVTAANAAAKADRDAEEEGLDLPNFSLEDIF